MNEISDTYSTASNVRISERESRPLERLEYTMKVEVHMQDSRVKKIDKQTKNEPTIIFWDETNKKIHRNSTSKKWSHRQLIR